jgi:hypothetical protein
MKYKLIKHEVVTDTTNNIEIDVPIFDFVFEHMTVMKGELAHFLLPLY